MTLQSSGAISINDLVGEYGGSTPHALNEYYRGGSLVDNHSNNGNVPTSGTIDLQDFYGANNDSPDDLVCVIAVSQSGIKHGSEGFRTGHASDNFGSASDSTLKQNVVVIPNALDKVKAISGNTFDWIELRANKHGADTGVIAQEIQALGLPGVTTVREHGIIAVDYQKLVPLLIEAIKELSTKVDALS